MTDAPDGRPAHGGGRRLQSKLPRPGRGPPSRCFASGACGARDAARASAGGRRHRRLWRLRGPQLACSHGAGGRRVEGAARSGAGDQYRAYGPARQRLQRPFRDAGQRPGELPQARSQRLRLCGRAILLRAASAFAERDARMELLGDSCFAVKEESMLWTEYSLPPQHPNPPHGHGPAECREIHPLCPP